MSRTETKAICNVGCEPITDFAHYARIDEECAPIPDFDRYVETAETMPVLGPLLVDQHGRTIR